MSRLPAAACALLALLLLLVGVELRAARRQADALDRQLAASTVREAQWRARADSLAHAYRVDTVRLDRALTRYDAVRVTDTLVVTRTDTVHHHDSTVVYVPRAAADSAVHACTLAQRTCEQRLALADSLATALTADRATLQASLAAANRAKGASSLLYGLAGVGVGVLLHAVIR